MKVLFVRSGNTGIDAISNSQGKSLEKQGIEVFYFDIIGRGIIGYLKNILPLRKAIQKNNPDIVHAHYSFSGIATTLTLTGRKTIVSLMGSDVYSASKKFKKLTEIFAKYCWKKVIVKSEEMTQNINIKEVSVIPNGVDFQIFSPKDTLETRKQLHLNETQHYILFSSTPERTEKNFPFAEKVFEKVQQTYPDTQFLFLIDKSPVEVADYINAADVMLLTSFYEGSPNIVKEAMACNCPVVSSNVGDVKKNISNSNHNYVIEGFNEDEFAKAIISIFNNGKRSNGRDFINNLDSVKIAKQLIYLYQNIT